MSSRFPCVIPVMEGFYLDLPRAAESVISTLEVGCGVVPRS